MGLGLGLLMQVCRWVVIILRVVGAHAFIIDCRPILHEDCEFDCALMLSSKNHLLTLNYHLLSKVVEQKSSEELFGPLNAENDAAPVERVGRRSRVRRKQSRRPVFTGPPID
jgi:hypothetical protein